MVQPGDDNRNGREAPLPGRSAWALAAGLFLLLALWLAWPWLSGRVTAPWDGKAHFQAQAAFLAQSLHNGQSPFWTPNIFAGHPQIADPQALIFNAGTLLMAWLTPNPTFAMVDGVAFASLAFGGLAVLGFARDRRWHPAAALVAALAFAFGGSAGWRIQHIGQILSLAYFPWAWWMLDRALRRGSARYGALAGLFAGLMVLGPDQVAYLGLVCLAGMVLVHGLAGAGMFARMRGAIMPLGAGALVGALVVGLPMLMVLAFAESSNRAQISLADAELGSVHPSHMLSYVIANLFGTIGPNEEFWGAPSLHWPYIVYSNIARNMANPYMGLVPLAGLVAALAMPALYRRAGLALPLMFGLMLAYALGRYTPVFPLAYAGLPGVDLFRRPADALFLAGAMGSLLAGYGLNHVLRGGLGGRLAALWLGLAGLALAGGLGMALWLGQLGKATPALLEAAGWLAFAGLVLASAIRLAPRRPLLVMVLLGVAVTADLARNLRPNDSTGLDPAVYDVLRPETQNETVLALKRLVVRDETRRDRVELAGLGFDWPNLALVHGLENTLGYNPLRLGIYSRATGATDQVAMPEQRKFAPLMPGYRSPLANLIGLRFVVTPVPAERIDPALAANPLTLVARTREGYIYENPEALPRVMLVPRAEPLDQDKLIETGQWPGTDFRAVAYIEPTGQPFPQGRSGGTARLVRYENTRIEVAVAAPQGGVLLLNDVWHPWWFASVDGQPAPVLRANGIFRAVILPPGAKTVRFEFRPLRGVMLGWRAAPATR